MRNLLLAGVGRHFPVRLHAMPSLRTRAPAAFRPHPPESPRHSHLLTILRYLICRTPLFARIRELDSYAAQLMAGLYTSPIRFMLAINRYTLRIPRVD